MRESSVESAKIAAGYGKWLISTILLLNAGAIAGLFTFMSAISAHHTVDMADYAIAIWWFVGGILAILLSGFTTWLNWSLVAASFDHYARPWMLVDPNAFPKDGAPGGWRITLTFWAP